MNKYSQIKELIQKNAGTFNRTGVFFTATVTETTGNTCAVKIGDFPLTGIRLLPVAEGVNSGILITPKNGSIVTIADFGSDLRNLQVIAYSDVESIKIMGGANGGIVLSEKVKSELDTVIQRVNNIVNALTNMATAATATGQTPVVGAALGTLITSNSANIITPLAKPQKTVFENSKITH